MPQSRKPVPKVAAGAATGSLVTILIYVAAQFGLEVPGEVGAALVTLLGFAASYIKA